MTELVRKLTATESTVIVPEVSPPVRNDEMKAVSNVHLSPVADAGSIALTATLRNGEPASHAAFNWGVASAVLTNVKARSCPTDGGSGVPLVPPIVMPQLNDVALTIRNGPLSKSNSTTMSTECSLLLRLTAARP